MINEIGKYAFVVVLQCIQCDTSLLKFEYFSASIDDLDTNSYIHHLQSDIEFSNSWRSTFKFSIDQRHDTLFSADRPFSSIRKGKNEHFSLYVWFMEHSKEVRTFYIVILMENYHISLFMKVKVFYEYNPVVCRIETVI